MLHGLFVDRASPLVWPKIVAILWLFGAVRVTLWAARARKWLAGFLLVTAPLGLILSVIASSGQWAFQNYRYIAPAFPLLMIVAACAFGPLLAGKARHACPIATVLVASS